MKNFSIIFGVILVLSASTTAIPAYGQGHATQPMLKDVRQAYVTIDHAGLEPNEPSVNWAGLQSQVASRLGKAGIKLAAGVAGQIENISELRITAKMLAVPDTEQFVFHIETSLYRFMALPGKDKYRISSPVWMSSATMQSTTAEDVNNAVIKAAMRQADEFIAAWKTAQVKNAPTAEPSNSKNHGSQSSSLKTENHPPALAATQAAQERYIASKNSKIFHLGICNAAKTISDENLVTFATRDAAVSSGRRPCKKCNP